MSSPLFLSWNILESQAEKRLDRFLSAQLNISRKKVKQLIHHGAVRHNSHIERAGSTVTTAGDHLQVYRPLLEYHQSMVKDQSPVAGNIPVLYEDSHILVIAKPSGLLSCPVAADDIHTLSLLSQYEGLFLCHRLDKDTSGAMIFAKEKLCFLKLKHLFSQHKITKKYLALVSPVPKKLSLKKKITIDHALTTQVNSFGKIQAQSQNSVKQAKSLGPMRRAITHITLTKYLTPKVALLECEPITGRTHQIRVHLEILGTSVLGDKLYGSGQWQMLAQNYRELFRYGHMLHSAALICAHPMNKERELMVHAPLPNYWQAILDPGNRGY
ncbi:MAG: RluA family pseudouridine synthase [Proteobacteria bacterium]|nr:RluA family pseudouridine synthase [Pseudomonadota bacterium]